jgi:hypothetical protein
MRWLLLLRRMAFLWQRNTWARRARQKARVLLQRKQQRRRLLVLLVPVQGPLVALVLALLRLKWPQRVLRAQTLLRLAILARALLQRKQQQRLHLRFLLLVLEPLRVQVLLQRKRRQRVLLPFLLLAQAPPFPLLLPLALPVG